ncbi:MAG: PEGA domain-containing protein, partial [Desulfobacterales bacterium]|nr:PEGA domain-containing protein [Desulfobacterales bacterium]
MQRTNLAKKIFIYDSRHKGGVAATDFPISIGGLSSSDLYLDCIAGQPAVALIDLEKNRLHIEPLKTTHSIKRNGKHLQTRKRLLNGDVIQIESANIHCQFNDMNISLKVDEFEARYAIQEPETLAVPQPAEEITPIQFRPQKPSQQTPSQNLLKKSLWVVLISFVTVLLIGAWYLFTAKQVSLQIQPEPDEVVIGGTLFKMRLGNYYLLLPGQYMLKASKQGYHPVQHAFEVSNQASQVVTLSLAKLPGLISVRAYPRGRPSQIIKDVRITIDGKDIGTAPIENAQIEAGPRQLIVSAKNYEVYQAQIDVEGMGQSQKFDIELIPSWSTVTFQSIPAGANVYIDNELQGQTPLTLSLNAGTYDVSLQADAYKPHRIKLEVQVNQSLELEAVELLPADGTIALMTTPGGANVTVGKEFVGQTPLEIALPANSVQTLFIAKAGYQNVKRQVRVTSGESKALQIKLTPLYGVVHFKVEPADADLFIDGKPQGTVPSKIRLIALDRRIEIRKKGYKTFQTRIRPRPGISQEIKVRLAKKGAITPSTPPIIKAANGYGLKLIPLGTYTMGSSRREQGRRSNETLRQIVLRRPFYMGIREITNQEFRQFASRHNSGLFKEYRLNQPKQPVAQVTWGQAVQFCNWLSQKDGLPPVYIQTGEQWATVSPIGAGYRLPTEAEWEYCARYQGIETFGKYPWGDAFPPTEKSVNIADLSTKDFLPVYLETYDDGQPVAAAVAFFKPNPLGLFDLGGNIAEWCHDFYSIYPYAPNKIYQDPVGPA